MTSDITGIDHLMVSVGDSATAAEIFSKMGFTITPQGQLPGMSNRLICFPNTHGNIPNFVELMSLDDEDAAPPPMAQALKVPDRPVLIVAASADAKTTEEKLSDAGIGVSPVIDGERDWTLPGGEVIDLAFSIVLPSPGQAPFYWIAVEHKTPQHYLRPDFTAHANGATAMSKIIAVAHDPRAAAKHYEKHWSATITGPSSGSGPVTVTRGDVQLQIHTHKELAKTYAGTKIERSEDHIVGFVARVGDTETVAEHLDNNGFSPMRAGPAIVVAPTKCCGCLVVFEPGAK